MPWNVLPEEEQWENDEDEAEDEEEREELEVGFIDRLAAWLRGPLSWR